MALYVEPNVCRITVSLMYYFISFPLHPCAPGFQFKQTNPAYVKVHQKKKSHQDVAQLQIADALTFNKIAHC